jgi:hypothetical protein
MDYYREVMTDDPFRRAERERQGKYADEDNKGDLFGLRQRPRHLRVLLDRESLGEPSSEDDVETDRILNALLTRYEPVDTLFVDMSKVNDPDDDDRTPNVVHLRDYTAQKGWSSYPGPLYGYRVCFARGRMREINGNIAPQPQLFQNVFGFAGEGGPHLAEVLAEDIQRHVLLTQTGRSLADMVISESPVVRRTDVPANYDANVFSRDTAIPVIAHYLRTQQIYILDPVINRQSNRKTFYHSAVYALAPGIAYWEAKADYVIDRRYKTDCNEMIGRLNRALKACDDLRFHLGALQTIDSYDDVADCVDRILWSLCGAVDVLARSLHHALRLPGEARYAKFHGSWYTSKFRSVYADAKGISIVDTAQGALATVFNLRNTIHYRALGAAGSPNDPAPYVGKDRGRVRLLIPNDVYTRIDPDEHSRWGIEEVATEYDMPATADLATVAAAAVDAVLSFLDHLSWMIAFEGIHDRAEVLKLDVFTVLKDGRETAARIRRMFGFHTAASEATDPIYPLE